MKREKKKNYKVILLTPPGLEGVDNAAAVLRGALSILNRHEFEPGLRFADEVTAKLEVEEDMEKVVERVKKETDIALVISCGFDKEISKPLVTLCKHKDVEFCHATDMPKPTMDEEIEALGEDPYQIKWRIASKEESKNFQTHTIDQAKLTEDLPASPEVREDRLNNAILLLSIAVMSAHYAKTPER